MAEHIFVFFFTGSQNYQLDSILTKFIHHISDQIKSFLICQTRYYTQHHRFRIDFQPQFFLKRRFILYFFLAERFRIILFRDHRICSGIIFVIINSIDDSTKTVASCPHQTIQTFPIERSFDLFRIGIADSRDRIRINQTAFQIIRIPVGFQLVRRKEIV